jgi:hypothetical protein
VPVGSLVFTSVIEKSAIDQVTDPPPKVRVTVAAAFAELAEEITSAGTSDAITEKLKRECVHLRMGRRERAFVPDKYDCCIASGLHNRLLV